MPTPQEVFEAAQNITPTEGAPSSPAAAQSPATEESNIPVVQIRELKSTDPADIYAALAAAQQTTEPQNNEPPSAAQAEAQSAPFDPNAWLNEQSKGAFKSWDEVQAAVNKPAEIKQPEFPNEESKAVYTALQEGKYEEVLPFLEARQWAAKVKDMSPEAIVMAKIARDYPSLDQEEVRDEYERMYVPDELSIPEGDLKREQKKAADRLKKSAEEAKKYFSSLTAEIKLPPVQAPAAQQETSPELSAEAKAVLAYGEGFAQDKVSVIPFQFQSNDKTTQINGKFEITKEKLKPIVDKITPSPTAFLAGVISKRWSQADGSINVEAVARDIYALENTQEMAVSVAEQTVRQSIEQFLRRQKNYEPVASAATAPPGGYLPTDAEKAEAAIDKFFRIPPAVGAN